MALRPNPTHLAVGSFVTDTMWDTLVDAALFGIQMPCASAYNTQGTGFSVTGTSSTNANLVGLDTVQYDKDPVGGTQARSTAHPSRLYFNYSGIWRITWFARFVSNATGYRQTFPRINAAGSPTGGALVEGPPIAAVSGTDTWPQFSICNPRVAGDYVELFVSSSQTGLTLSGAISAQLQIELVSG